MTEQTPMPGQELSVSEVAARAGISISTLHFYERRGLIVSRRTGGNHRRYRREVLRRVAFIRVAQRVGIPLVQIAAALDELPEGRTPTRADWQQLSARWKVELDQRIRALRQLRDDFSGCIGCGCLSVDRCALINPHDQLRAHGPGPRQLLEHDGEEALIMAVELNHTIVASKDRVAAARFLAELLGLPAPTSFGPFQVIELANAMSLDFATTEEEIHPQHYAFLVSETEFDETFARITARGIAYWADPRAERPEQINTNDGGRGLYFHSPDGHYLEILTRPYGSGG